MVQENNCLIVRDHLALDRTKLANQRTLLSYIRTAIMLFASGVTIIKFIPLSDVLFYFGLISIGLAMVFLATGIMNYNTNVKNIKSIYAQFQNPD